MHTSFKLPGSYSKKEEFTEGFAAKARKNEGKANV